MEILNKVFDSDYGKFKVIQKMPREHGKASKYKIMFLDTGNECFAYKYNILNSSVRDKKGFKKYEFIGKIIESKNYGKFKVIQIVRIENINKNRPIFEIEFLETGYKTLSQLGAIQTRQIRDPYKKVKYGVACVGKIGKHHYLYNRWCCMISRCYNPKDTAYSRYGGQGIFVCNEWLCFEKFIKEAVLVKGFNEQLVKINKLQLDKDKSGGKIYSKSTCEWVTPSENCLLKTKRGSP